jgi:molybdate transport system substrate-binding protein
MGLGPNWKYCLLKGNEVKGIKLKFVTITILTALILGLPLQARCAETVTVFAAASLTNALTEIGNMFAAKGAGTVTPSFAASSTLAKQIENGAPANVFISADEAWMSYLSEKRLIVPDSRFDLLGNRVVLVAPADSNLKVDIKQGLPLAELLGDGRLATGDPDHVPAGKYAKTALEKLGVWAGIEGKLARADNVRAALALVERGECPLGIVYSTDAAISKKVKIVGTFPEDSHPPVTYPAALVTGKDAPEARSFLNFLKTPEAKAVFEKYGFTAR